MTMKNQWLLNIVMVILSWLTMPLLGWRTFRRFLPASIRMDRLNGEEIAIQRIVEKLKQENK